jgi:uncharacterized membrane protein YphA (DoxX/SURF4 family)
MKRENIITGIRAALILLFFYAGVGKIAAPVQFARDMFNQPFPHWFSAILIFLVPAVEVCLAALLMLEKTSSYALKGAAVLMGLFTLYTVIMFLPVFKNIPSVGTGVIRSFSWLPHLFFNLLFLALAVIGFLMSKQLVQDKIQRNNKETGHKKTQGTDQKSISLSV